MNLEKLFSDYLQHGKFLRGWSSNTELVYKRAFASFQQSLGPQVECMNSVPTKAQLEAWVIWMRSAQACGSPHKRNLTPACVNIYIRAMNSFLSWLKTEGRLEQQLKLKQVPDPKRPITVFSEDDIRRIIAFRPKTFTQLRTWTLVEALLDTGCRINELLTLTVDNVDFDNLLLTVDGKGNRTRKVPFSPEARKALFRYKVQRDKLVKSRFLFCARTGSGLRYRNVYREILDLCHRVGITKRVHIHLTRHTFACHWIKNGGSATALSRILGHSSINTTNIYLRGLGVEDFKDEHLRFSPLSRR